MHKFFIVLVAAWMISGRAYAIDLGQGSSAEILSAIEKVATRFYVGKTLHDISPDTDDPVKTGFNQCHAYATGLGLDEEHFGGAVDIAAFVVLMRADLTSPVLRKVADPYFQRLEAVAVDRLDALRGFPSKLSEDDAAHTETRLRLDLAKALNKAMVANGMSKGDRYVIQECGGGEIHVRLITRPDSAKVYVIKLFDYTLCEVRDIDPADKERCFGWMLNAPEVLDMSGWYQYQAIWPDGKVSSGRFSVTEKLFMANMDEDHPLTLTISR